MCRHQPRAAARSPGGRTYALLDCAKAARPARDVRRRAARLCIGSDIARNPHPAAAHVAHRERPKRGVSRGQGPRPHYETLLSISLPCLQSHTLPACLQDFNPHGLAAHGGKLYAADPVAACVWVFALRSKRERPVLFDRIDSHGLNSPRGVMVLKPSGGVATQPFPGRRRGEPSRSHVSAAVRRSRRPRRDGGDGAAGPLRGRQESLPGGDAAGRRLARSADCVGGGRGAHLHARQWWRRRAACLPLAVGRANGAAEAAGRGGALAH